MSSSVEARPKQKSVYQLAHERRNKTKFQIVKSIYEWDFMDYPREHSEPAKPPQGSILGGRFPLKHEREMFFSTAAPADIDLNLPSWEDMRGAPAPRRPIHTLYIEADERAKGGNPPRGVPSRHFKFNWSTIPGGNDPAPALIVKKMRPQSAAQQQQRRSAKPSRSRPQSAYPSRPQSRSSSHPNTHANAAPPHSRTGRVVSRPGSAAPPSRTHSRGHTHKPKMDMSASIMASQRDARAIERNRQSVEHFKQSMDCYNRSFF